MKVLSVVVSDAHAKLRVFLLGAVVATVVPLTLSSEVLRTDKLTLLDTLGKPAVTLEASDGAVQVRFASSKVVYTLSPAGFLQVENEAASARLGSAGDESAGAGKVGLWLDQKGLGGSLVVSDKQTRMMVGRRDAGRFEVESGEHNRLSVFGSSGERGVRLGVKKDIAELRVYGASGTHAAFMRAEPNRSVVDVLCVTDRTHHGAHIEASDSNGRVAVYVGRKDGPSAVRGFLGYSSILDEAGLVLSHPDGTQATIMQGRNGVASAEFKSVSGHRAFMSTDAKESRLELKYAGKSTNSFRAVVDATGSKVALSESEGGAIELQARAGLAELGVSSGGKLGVTLSAGADSALIRGSDKNGKVGFRAGINKGEVVSEQRR